MAAAVLDRLTAADEGGDAGVSVAVIAMWCVWSGVLDWGVWR